MMLSRIAQQSLIYSLIALVIVWGYIPDLWNMKWPALVLLGIAVISLLAWMISGLSNLKVFLSKRSSQFGISLVISAVSVLGILIAINVAANLYNQKKDITKNQLYSLSSQSTNVAKQLKENIEIEIWTTNIQQMAPNQDLKKFLENYRIQSGGKISISIKNPNEDLSAKEKNISKDNILLFRSASGRESRIENLNKDKVEEQVTNAIVQTIKGVKKTVCFTTDHGELRLEDTENSGISQVKQALEASAYLTKSISLIAATTIPSDCEALVIAGPKSEPTPSGLETINKYIANNGKALVLFGAMTPQKWNSVVKAYGVEFRDDIVLDLRVQPPTILATQNYNKSVDIVSAMDRPVILPQAASLVVPTSAKSGNFEIKTFVSSDATAFSKKKKGQKAIRAQMEPSDQRGPLVVAALIEDPAAAKQNNAESGSEASPLDFEMPHGEDGHHDHDGHDHGFYKNLKHFFGLKVAHANQEKGAPPIAESAQKPSETKLVVISNDLFVSNGFSSQLGNLDLFMNSISYLLSDKDIIGIRPRELKATRLQLSNETDRKVQATVYLLAGLCFLGAFIAASRRRKTSV